ncbi:MAG: hypothetical protein QW828_07910, partial [Candidatus Bathyarchaeia archaeon]
STTVVRRVGSQETGGAQTLIIVYEARRYAFTHYGNLISIGEPEFDNKTRTWVIQLRSDYPRLIRDDRAGEKILRFLSMEKLGSITFNEKMRFVRASSRKECLKALGSYLNMWRDRAEKIIVTASSDQLSRIGEIQWVLAPIRMIVSNLIQKETISFEEVIRLRHRRSKVEKYLKFLADVGIVRPVEDGYTYGNLLAALGEKLIGEDLNTAVLSHIIRDHYSMLRQIFDIRQISPFIHIESSYYCPALEADKLLYRKEESIVSQYASVYGDNPLRARYVLNELVHVDALRYDRPYYYGNEQLFDRMQEMKGDLPDLSPPRA